MKTNKTQLNDLIVGKLKPTGKQYDRLDSIVPGFGIRVGPTGSKVWIFRDRTRGRFTFGTFPGTSIKGKPVLDTGKARDQARAWFTAKGNGVILADVQRAETLAREKARGELFEPTVERYIEEYVSQTRSYEKSAREIRRYLVPTLGKLRLNDIEPGEVGKLIEKIAKTAPYQARAALTHLKTFYNWAIAKGLGGVRESPVRDLKPVFVIGRNKIKPRDRALSIVELRAFWNATERLGYPFGDLYRLLFLTGSRYNEIAQAQWAEIDEDEGTLTVPAERYKTEAEHVIQLSDWAWRIVESIKARGAHRDYLFSAGQKEGFGVINSGGKPKARLDALIAEELAKLKSNRPFEPFKVHDLRRTLKTQLHDLGVADEVSEAILGHARKGIKKTYNVSKLARPIRDAFALHAKWLAKQGITPPPKGGKVVSLRKAA